MHTVFVLLILIFTTTLIPIEESLSINGKIIPSNDVAIIRHERGGVVNNVLVKNYSHVNKGDIIIQLDDSELKSSLKSKKDRLEIIDVEINDAVSFLKNNLTDVKDSELQQKVSSLIDSVSRASSSSNKLYTANRDLFYSSDNIIEEKIQKNKNKLKSFSSKLKLIDNEISVVKQQKEIFSTLLKSKNVSKIKALDYELKYIQSIKDREDIVKDADETNMQIKELLEEKKSNKHKFFMKVYEKLIELNKEKVDLTSNVQNLKYWIAKMIITAPLTGHVQGLDVSIGENIKSEDKILSIIPENTELLFEGEMQLSQKGRVSELKRAEIQLDGFNVIEYGRLSAKIINISPYIFSDAFEKSEYSKIILKIDSQKLQENKKLQNLQPGMSGTAFIYTDEYSFFKFLFGPIYDTFSNRYNQYK